MMLETVKGWGIESAEFVNTSESTFSLNVLLPFMVGTIDILRGRKCPQRNSFPELHPKPGQVVFPHCGRGRRGTIV
jgi:hypothetical protein